MPLQIIRDDLVNMRSDAIVLPSNEALIIDGGAGWAVAKAAGLEDVQKACMELEGCQVGHAVATHAGAFPAKYFIHAVGPVWHGGEQDLQLLQSAYDSALNLAAELECDSVALPLLSAGVYGCPPHVSLSVALASIRQFLADCDMEVTLVLFNKAAVAAGLDFLGEIECRIDDAYAQMRAVEEGQSVVLPMGSSPREGAWTNRPQFSGAQRAAEEGRAAKYAPQHVESRRRRRQSSPFDRIAEWRREWMESRETKADQPTEELFEKAEEREEAIDQTAAFAAVPAPAFEPAEEPTIAAAPEPMAAPAEAAVPAPASAGAVKADEEAEVADFGYAAAPMPAPKPSAAPTSAPTPSAAPASAHKPSMLAYEAAATDDLESRLGSLDEGFSQTLLKIIDRSGLTDSQVYRRANMTRQHFSKIRTNAGYRPTKATVLALCVALELDLAQTRDLLARAGFALSHASKFDIIVEYFIEHGIYDSFKINEALFYFDQQLLG